jgi:hypothetical protein
MDAPAITGYLIFHRRSTVYPRPLDSFSTSFTQGRNRRKPQKIHGFSAGFDHVLRMLYQQPLRHCFHQDFRILSREISGLSRKEKWRKSGGKCPSAEKCRRSGGRPPPVGAGHWMHTKCDTWNILPWDGMNAALRTRATAEAGKKFCGRSKEILATSA